MTTSFFKLLCAACMSALFMSSIVAHADGVDEPIPSFYQEPGLSPNRDFINQHPDEHIDPFTGKLQWHFVDLFIPGNGGMDLKVQRSYTSLGVDFPEPSPVGYGWTMHFGRVLRKANVDICYMNTGAVLNPVLELPDGSRQILYVALDGSSFITTGFWRASCDTSSGGSNGMAVYSPDGTRYDMTTPGAPLGTPDHPVNTYYTSKITDRNGNWMAFSYVFVGTSFGVSEITTSDGRDVKFTYNGGALSSMTDGVRTWTYVASSNFLNEVDRPDGTAWKFTYYPLSTGAAGSGSMQSVTYPTGGTISYAYDFVDFTNTIAIPHSVVVTQKTADNATWTYSYKPATQSLPGDVELWTSATDDQLDVTTVNSPDGTRIYRYIGYRSAPSGGVFQIGQPWSEIIGNDEASGYSHNMQLISLQPNQRPGDGLTYDNATYASIFWGKNTNRNGQSYNFSYDTLDQYGNPTSISENGTDQKTTTVSYAIDTGKWILHLKKDESISVPSTDGSLGSASVGSITRNYDANGNLLSESRFGVPTNFTYTTAGDLFTRTDARSKTVTYGNYYRGIPQTEDHLQGVTISRTVNASGNVVSETDGEQSTTGYEYDALNRLTKITHPVGNPVNIAWTYNTRTITRGDYKEVVTYDAFGREAGVAHTDGGTGETISSKNQYDAVGRRIFASYPNSSAGTKYDYDILGRVVREAHAFDPATGLASAQRFYSHINNQVVLTNERNLNYTYTYRGYGNADQLDLMAIDAPESSASVSIKRNPLGQITEVDQGGKARIYNYDSRYFLLSKQDPETGTTQYARDEVGNMTGRAVGSSGQATFVYDDLNRLISIAYPDGQSTGNTYYNDNKLKSVTNGTAAQGYIYDGNKNLLQETLTVDGKSFVTNYAYNGNDALDVLTYGSGKTVTYSPDAFGRPTKAAPYVTSVTHHPSGQVKQITYANGVTTSVDLNARLWPSTLKVSNTSPIFNKNYFYDGIGNVVEIDENTTGTAKKMGYDNIDRLINATGPWSGAYTVSYDGRGNIQSQAWGGGANARAYTYDPSTDLLTNVAETNSAGTTNYGYAYDAYGNVTAKGALNFAYTDASTMKCAKCGAADEADYAYDGGNMRVKVQKGGATTYFVYGLGGNLLWEDTPGINIKEYVYLSGKQVATREKTASAP